MFKRKVKEGLNEVDMAYFESWDILKHLKEDT
jgi:hypothetical protein